MHEPTSEANLSESGTLIRFGLIENGTAEDERIGKLVTHLGFEYRVRLDRPIAMSSMCVRLITGIWKQALTGIPSINEILDPNGAPMYLAPFQSENSTNMVILGDEFLNFPAQASLGGFTINSEAIDETVLIKRRFKYRGQQEYIGTELTGVANWFHFVIIIGQQDAAGTYHFHFNNDFIDT